MIPRTLTQNTDWKNELRQAVTRPEELLALLQLPKSQWLNAAKQAASHFPLKAPRSYVSRMQKGNAKDPLLLQVMPLGLELEQHDDYRLDPVGDGPATSLPGLIHKYRNRALLISTGACAVHCRYCFRRHFPYSDSVFTPERLDQTLEYLDAHDELNEVILSGGDPLMLDDSKLGNLLRRIRSINHIRWLRIHTRLPVVLPERVDEGLIDQLSNNLPISMVIHCNHPNEIDPDVMQAMTSLNNAGIRLYNQSVLLRGINDNADTQCELSHRLYDAGVQPYYLHMLDRVQGAAHFEVSDSSAASIYREMQSRLSGLLLPRLVREIAGASSKTLINIDA